MQKILKVIFVLISVAFGAFAFSPRPQQTGFYAENSIVEISAAAPKDLYIRNCARCHGADGKSQTELGQTLEAADLTAEKTSIKRNIQAITKGVGDMPAFGKKLSKRQIASLAAYARKL